MLKRCALIAAIAAVFMALGGFVLFMPDEASRDAALQTIYPGMVRK